MRSPPRAAPPRPKRGQPRFDIDRVVLMRVALVAIVVLFLYLILQVSMIAFGGSSAKKTKRIERAVDATSARDPTAGSATKADGATVP